MKSRLNSLLVVSALLGAGAGVPRRVEGEPANDVDRAKKKTRREEKRERLAAKAEAKRQRRRERNLSSPPIAQGGEQV